VSEEEPINNTEGISHKLNILIEGITISLFISVKEEYRESGNTAWKKFTDELASSLKEENEALV
jgi:hypothetical protein